MLTGDLQKKGTPVIFAKFSRTPYFTEHLKWLLLTVSCYQPTTLVKNRFQQRCFSVNYAKCLRISFDRTAPSDCFVSLSVNFEFFRTPLLYKTFEKLLISCTSYKIATRRYSEKVFHRWFSSILCKNEKELFEGVHLLKILENYLWRGSRSQPVSLRKKLFHISSLIF